MNITTVTAYLAAGGAAVALLKQAYDLWKARRTEKKDIEEALERSPLVREQLAIGNVGEAVKVLNQIIESQNRHIVGQDERIAELEGQVTEERSRRLQLEGRERQLEHLVEELREELTLYQQGRA